MRSKHPGLSVRVFLLIILTTTFVLSSFALNGCLFMISNQRNIDAIKKEMLEYVEGIFGEIDCQITSFSTPAYPYVDNNGDGTYRLDARIPGVEGQAGTFYIAMKSADHSITTNYYRTLIYDEFEEYVRTIVDESFQGYKLKVGISGFFSNELNANTPMVEGFALSPYSRPYFIVFIDGDLFSKEVFMDRVQATAITWIQGNIAPEDIHMRLYLMKPGQLTSIDVDDYDPSDLSRYERYISEASFFSKPDRDPELKFKEPGNNPWTSYPLFEAEESEA